MVSFPDYIFFKDFFEFHLNKAIFPICTQFINQFILTIPVVAYHCLLYFACHFCCPEGHIFLVHNVLLELRFLNATNRFVLLRLST